MSFIIRLQNLSKTAKSANIREFFANLSIPGGSVCIVGGDSGEAFIGFETDEDARQAMLRDGLILCQNRVKLSLSSRKEMQEAMERAQKLSNMLKGLEKALRTDSIEKNNIRKPFSINSQSERNDFLHDGLQIHEQASVPRSNPIYNQVNNDSINASAYNPTNSWIPNANQSQAQPAKQEEKPATDSSWKEFLEQALQRIEKAKGQTSEVNVEPVQQVENKTGASMLGPPRNVHSQHQSPQSSFNSNKPPPSFNSNKPPPSNSHFNQPPKSTNNNFPTFKSPPTKSHQYGQIHQPINKPPINNTYRQHNSKFPQQNGPKPPQKLSPPRFSPPVNKFAPKSFDSQINHKVDHQVRPIQPSTLMPTESEFEATLRQQQLAAVEQMAVPNILPTYDPEELFVELSRLPSNLIEENALKQFLLPVVPVEIRMVYANGVHMLTVLHCANKADANAIINRNNELGIKIRWSKRQAFFTLPPTTNVPLAQLNPQVWDLPSSKEPTKRPSDQFQSGIDAKRPKNDGQTPIFSPRQEPSWNSVNSAPIAKSLMEQSAPPLDPNRSYVLLSNVSFKANNWDVNNFIEESGVHPLKTTHVYSQDSERSDKWLIECESDSDAKKLIGSQLFILGRQIRAELLTPMDAQGIYTNGYRQKWPQRPSSDKHSTQNHSNQKSFFGAPTTQNSQSKQSKQPTQSGGFFSAPAYGKIRSATKPNPSFQARNLDSNHQDSEENGVNEERNGNNFRGFQRGREAPRQFGRGNGNNNNYQQRDGNRGRGSSYFRGGNRGFQKGRGFQREDGQESEVAT